MSDFEPIVPESDPDLDVDMSTPIHQVFLEAAAFTLMIVLISFMVFR